MMDTPKLLIRCAEALDGDLAPGDVEALARWHAEAAPRARDLTGQLVASEAAAWPEAILCHRAHTHPWYGYLAECSDIACFAAFMLENRYFPAFLPMLDKIRGVQICDRGRQAVDDNIADEHVPVPHNQLMARLMEAVRNEGSPNLTLSLYPSLIDRTLVFYYGYFCAPWHLVGSLFATELMGVHRVTQMGIGLRRLGIAEHDLGFIAIHSQCDDEHARQWREGVILPSIARAPQLKRIMAAGIAECLDSSARYLDDLLSRTTPQQRRAALRP